MIQISCGLVPRFLHDPAQFPFLYRTLPKEESQYLGIVKLLLHFQWTWIGLVAPDTDNGEQFLRIFPTLASKSGVCVAFSLSIPVTTMIKEIEEKFLSSAAFLWWTKVNVLVYYGEPQAFATIPDCIQKAAEDRIKPPVGKIWVTTALWDLTHHLFYSLYRSGRIHGFLSFSLQTNKRTNIGSYRIYDIRQLGRKAFDCFYSKPASSVKGKVRCRERENLGTISQSVKETIHSLDSFSSFNAIFTVARALHATYSSGSKQMLARDTLGPQKLKLWQFHTFLRNILLHNTSMGEGYLDEKGNVAVDFDIVTWMGFPNSPCPVPGVPRAVSLGTPRWLKKERHLVVMAVRHARKGKSPDRKVGDSNRMSLLGKKKQTMMQDVTSLFTLCRSVCVMGWAEPGGRS
ncbi:UNVERIFIED_CONTAM: hypothetical protein K2H54_064849 [Gekko kuhli]